MRQADVLSMAFFAVLTLSGVFSPAAASDAPAATLVAQAEQSGEGEPEPKPAPKTTEEEPDC